MGITFDDVLAAQDRIAREVRVTPLWPSATLEAALKVPIYLKCEHMQRTGSFKIRGATNFVARLSPDQRERGLVAASAGNHAQGVALAGSSLGLDVLVVMPVSAPLAKANATRGYGARVILQGENLEEARKEAQAIAGREGRVYVPPFDHDDVIAGQGTVGLELVEQLPEVAEVLVPAGGGGLLAGVALAVKSRRPEARVVGVQSAAMDGIARSVEAGRRVEAPASRTIADGVAVSGPSDRTFELIRKYVDEVITVGEEAIADGIVMLIERSKMIVEGAGAVAVAALRAEVYRPQGPTVAVVSGGNIDINLLGSIVRHGLVEAGRYQRLTVEVSDTPGQLALVTQAIASAGGNVIEVEHNREAPGMPVGVAVIDLLLEVNGRHHFDEIIRCLRDRGLRGVPGSPARLATPRARELHSLA